MSSEQTAPPVRDVRVDRIGYARELNEQYAEKLRDAVKLAHPTHGTRLEGDHFDGLIVVGSSTSITARQWYGLYARKKITLNQFLDGISVSAAKARATLDAVTFDRIAETAAKSPELRVTRKKGVEVDLVAALRSLNQDVDPRYTPAEYLPAAA